MSDPLPFVERGVPREGFVIGAEHRALLLDLTRFVEQQMDYDGGIILREILATLFPPEAEK